MKVFGKIMLTTLCIMTCQMATAQGNCNEDNEILKEFETPSQAARPQVWWHWMDGNVSKEGIRKDLEWMKRSGFGGLHQFDAGGVNMPRAAKVRLPYLSDGWKDAFRYALNLADSLGLDVTIASAPGWSSTGGTWVTPEDAVKKLEWRSIDVESNGKVSVTLPELYRTVGPFQDYYVGNDRIDVNPYGKDLHVIAVRKPADDKSMEEMGASLTQCDTMIVCKFSKPQTIKAFTLQSYAMGGRPRTGEPVCRNILECSSDGKTWSEVHKVLPSGVPYLTEDITPTKARYFRVRGQKLKSLELFTVTRINHIEEVAGYSIAFDFNKFHTAYSKNPAKTSDVVDLTADMQPDGTLSCTLPKGRWRIYRFGWSITGKINHPASPEATGLEVDKLDPDAWMRYFHTYVDLYKEAAGGMLGPKGIRYLLTDSYEAGSLTWTKNMEQEFRSRRGYDLLPWMPVLAGEVIGSTELSEKFLWDWRKTIGELFCENYDRINDIVKEYGLAGRWCETHEGGKAYIGDGMDPRITSTVPMAAIWMDDTPAGSPVPGAIADIKEAASVAHIFGQNFVAAESFSVCGDEGHAYTYCPENMKYVADVAMSAGLNRFVIHESASQPNDSYLPGLQLFRYGQWLHRNETWAEYARYFTDYLARSCALLQEGHAVNDILLYYGEDCNATALYGGNQFSGLPAIPAGFDYDFANPTVILKGVEAADGMLESKSGARYRILWMDKNHETMSVEILRRIREFADKGVIICGTEPAHCAGMLGDEKEFTDLVNDIWHASRANVVATLEKGIAAGGLKPDFIGNGFRYVHRNLADGTQIYWIRNFSGEDKEAELSFRCGGKNCTLLNAETGKAMPAEYVEKDGRYLAYIPLKATDAAFIIFSDNPLAKESKESMEEFFDMSILPGSEIIKELDKPWKAHFEQKNGGKANAVFYHLESWTEKNNPVIKYFAGTAEYSTVLDVDASELENNGKIALDFGSVKNIAEVSINGKQAGVFWKAPFRTGNIRGLLVPGENKIEVKVTNLWRNRMIGDVQPGETEPVTAIRRFYKANDPVIPSGLLGPARLISYK